MKNDSDIRRSILSQPYLADLILYLKDHGRVMANQLLEVHSNYPKMMTLVLKLQILGLVEISETVTPHKTKWIQLTRRGKTAAGMILRFDNLVSEGSIAGDTKD